ncbi:universal stress protein [Allosediminivita pacifica]|uniref:Universal stress protein F n=1 Tax=Allosediminivita pacifica TaxID=1267769 RepID=A0A2T6B7H6_9RHOB|nr:universal stress protein [Allosediminivita pacifica]PTX51982.1 universal stress protein F [Allosediminivita pacifica]GGA98140.1 hypothetical protein GCM10011324_05490 [Allosediminivita pacifica]
MHDRILVPIKPKHAKHSTELMQKAVSMARGEEAEIIAVTIVPEIEANLRVRPDDHKPELDAFVALQDTSGVKVRTMIRTGAPHRAITSTAKEFGCDLIVLNSSNPRIADYLMGSTASYVVTHALCDVFVVRQQGS